MNPNLAIQTIAEQLTEIYFKEEWWHSPRLTLGEALKYHQDKLDSGNIVCYLDNGEVLGYYERFINGDTCTLANIYIKKEVRQGKIFKELYRHFFKTLPLNIVKIVGTKQKIHGKFIERIITKERRNGKP